MTLKFRFLAASIELSLPYQQSKCISTVLVHSGYKGEGCMTQGTELEAGPGPASHCSHLFIYSSCCYTDVMGPIITRCSLPLFAFCRSFYKVLVIKQITLSILKYCRLFREVPASQYFQPCRTHSACEATVRARVILPFAIVPLAFSNRGRTQSITVASQCRRCCSSCCLLSYGDALESRV